MKSKKKKTTGFRLGYDRATQLQLHTLMLPGTVLMLLFSIVPLFGLLLAFKNYSVIAVSYTHLDVYKRQNQGKAEAAAP